MGENIKSDEIKKDDRKKWMGCFWLLFKISALFIIIIVIVYFAIYGFVHAMKNSDINSISSGYEESKKIISGLENDIKQCKSDIDANKNNCIPIAIDYLKTAAEQRFVSFRENLILNLYNSKNDDAISIYKADKLPLNEEMLGSYDIKEVVIKDIESDKIVAKKDFGSLKKVVLGESYTITISPNNTITFFYINYNPYGCNPESYYAQGCDRLKQDIIKDYKEVGGLWKYSEGKFSHILNVDQLAVDTGYDITPQISNISYLGNDNNILITVNFTTNNDRKSNYYIVDYQKESFKLVSIK